jgi:probable addiction module antidote protein
MKKSRPYTDFLFERLKDPEEAAAYLNAALEDEDPGVFLIALKDIAQANGGMTYVAREAHLNRETLYRTLSKKGNPTLTNLRALLGICGLEIAISPAHQHNASKARRKTLL